VISTVRILSAAAAPARWIPVFLLLPLAVCLAFEPRDASLLRTGVLVPRMIEPFVGSALVALGVWAAARFVGRRRAHEDLLEREAYLAVALGWLLATFLASLPFFLSGRMGEADALFEAMSGLTGTGMTSLRGPPDQLPVSLLVWRAQLQWAGGLAFIVLTVAVLSRLTHGGLQLLRGEATGSGVSRIRPKVAEVARGLGRLYLALTAVFVVVLFLLYRYRLGLPRREALLEAMVEVFAAYGNGAFTLHLAGTGHHDAWVQAALGLIMVAGATNVTLAFLLVRRGQVRTLFTNPEWRFFLALVGTLATGILLILWRQGGLDLAGARSDLFQVVSLATGTGLFAVDYAAWPHAALVLVMLAFLVGGTAGSAAGGIKSFRALLLVKTVVRETRRLVHPRAQVPVRVGRRVVSEETVMAVIAFFFSYLVLWVLGTFLLALAEPSLDLMESASASLAALGNVAGGFGSVGPAFGTASLGAGKAVLAVLMWFGRMEILAAILVFTPQSWRS
jgi:trk system potassium uptake protein